MELQEHQTPVVVEVEQQRDTRVAMAVQELSSLLILQAHFMQQEELLLNQAATLSILLQVVEHLRFTTMLSFSAWTTNSAATISNPAGAGRDET